MLLNTPRTIGTIGYMGGVMALPEPFCWSMVQMVQYNHDYVCDPGERIYYIRATNSFHSFARNTMVKQFKGDWLLMMDTDHSFQPDILSRMLRVLTLKPEVQVLSALYQYKGPPHAPKLYRFGKTYKDFNVLGKWDIPKNTNKTGGKFLVPIDMAGAGCLLIKREVFEKMKKRFKEDPFDIIHPYGEDNSFFLRLKKIGIQAYCDPTIEFPHLEYKEITMKDFDADSLSYKKFKIVPPPIDEPPLK